MGMASEDAHDVVVDVTVVGCDSSRYAGFRRSIEMLSSSVPSLRVKYFADQSTTSKGPS